MAVRDPQGIRPLAMGKMGGEIVFASESCAFDSIGAKFVRDVVRAKSLLLTEAVFVASKATVDRRAVCVYLNMYTLLVRIR